MGRISRTRGKQTELAVARYWGCRRAHFEAHDLTGHPILSIEVKCRQAGITTIEKWMSQAIAAAEDGRIPVVHYHVLGRDYGDDFIIIRAKDLRDIVGTGGEYGSAQSGSLQES